MTEFTISQANTLLAKCGFGAQFVPETVERIKALAPLERIVKALKRGAAGDRGACAWLKKRLEEIGVDPATGTHTQAEAPTAPIGPPPAAPNTPEDTMAAPPPTHQASSRTPEGTRIEHRQSIHVYGGKGALCFEADETRNQVETVSLDAAKALAARKYDWGAKIRLQLTRQELPVVAAVLLGYLPKCEFKNHGPTNDKGFSMENQGQHVFVKVWAKDQGQRAVPIEAGDLYYVIGLVVRQLRKQQPWLDGNALGLVLQSVGRRLST